ncbi:MAG: hypothetical protein VB085_02415 [Peptococcaceae bacterium]|nr:hypothetical protein [Peptococcaceae bacterium]
MKRYFSVLMIAARSTIYKITGLLLLMGAAEAALFYRLLQKSAAEGPAPLESLITRSRLSLICGLAFFLLCVILSLVGYEFSGSKTRYTIQRLSLPEEAAVLLWAFYNMLCFLIFWAAQLLVVLLLCRLYISVMEPTYWNRQTIFLAFYRSGFLHSLLPLEETSRWLRNGALILGLGLAGACFPLKQRRGQKGLAMAVLAALTFITFPQEMGSFGSDAIIMLIALGTAAYSFYGIWWGPRDES